MTFAEIKRYVQAMRADSVRIGERGLWYIERQRLEHLPHFVTRWCDKYDVEPSLTALLRWTGNTLLHGRGESVMSDDPQELVRHLPAIIAARGRVLVSGLGLGCVVRGLLANPAVTAIDVVEIDRHVHELVAKSFMPDQRLRIYLGDAVTMRWDPAKRWDLAWHDVWSDQDGNHDDPGIGTQGLHAMLLRRYYSLAKVQGAWQFPRMYKRMCAEAGKPLINGKRRWRDRSRKQWRSGAAALISSSSVVVMHAGLSAALEPLRK